ncbi:MAG TPA: histidine kinase dimerization/phospho-acceptor domain-containing protein [Anaeromyxobacteraceae bacterium]|nr:histidine kinase dimerization/phospho-acceptor domain-containing protein [Anaeromyxobacteraceae bacterium]
MISEGAAFLDRAGRLLAADAAFRALLGLPDDEASEALAQRVAADPSLAAFLAERGPETMQLEVGPGHQCLSLSRTSCQAGLLVRAAQVVLSEPIIEHAVQALALTRLAGSVAHEIKNPLNAMALQLALLGDKIGAANEALALSCAGNLGSLKNQVTRINEVVRRYLDVADPTPSGSFDACDLLADVTNLFGHEARRRRLAYTCEPAQGAVRAKADPIRVARLLLGLLLRAITVTPPGGRLVARATSLEQNAAIVLEHTRGPSDGALSWVSEVVSAASIDMGGRLDESSEGDMERAALVLPKERPS